MATTLSNGNDRLRKGNRLRRRQLIAKPSLRGCWARRTCWKLAGTTVRAKFHQIGIDSHTTPILPTFFIRIRGGDYNASSDQRPKPCRGKTLRLFHDSFQEEGGLTLQGSNVHSTEWFPCYPHVIPRWQLLKKERNVRLVSTDALGVGTRDESLRESAWEATVKETTRPRKLFL